MFYRVGINPIVFTFPPVRGYVIIGLYMYANASTYIEKPFTGSLKAPSHTFLFEYCHRKYRAFSYWRKAFGVFYNIHRYILNLY